MDDVAKRRGRPSVYSPDMCDKVIELMSQGASKHEVAAELNICYDTLNEWSKPDSPQYNQDFSDSIKEGMLLCRAWWERNGRINLENTKFNTPLWSKNMAARFHEEWGEKKSVAMSGSVDLRSIFSEIDGQSADLPSG